MKRELFIKILLREAPYNSHHHRPTFRLSVLEATEAEGSFTVPDSQSHSSPDLDTSSKDEEEVLADVSNDETMSATHDSDMLRLETNLDEWSCGLRQNILVI